LATLMAEVPELEPAVRLYERLLAHEYTEAAGLVDEQTQRDGPETVYDALVVPVLCYAERDLLEQRLTPDDEREVVDAARELVQEVAPAVRQSGGVEVTPTGADRRVLAVAIDPVSDHLALDMLGTLVERDGVRLDAAPARVLPSELVTLVQSSGYPVVCIADLPPSAPSKTRYLVKKLRAALPDCAVLVGRWSPPALRDESTMPLVDAGATAVSPTLLDTRDQLRKLLPAASASPGTPPPAHAVAR